MCSCTREQWLRFGAISLCLSQLPRSAKTPSIPLDRLPRYVLLHPYSATARPTLLSGTPQHSVDRIQPYSHSYGYFRGSTNQECIFPFRKPSGKDMQGFLSVDVELPQKTCSGVLRNGFSDSRHENWLLIRIDRRKDSGT